MTAAVGRGGFRNAIADQCDSGPETCSGGAGVSFPLISRASGIGAARYRIIALFWGDRNDRGANRRSGR